MGALGENEPPKLGSSLCEVGTASLGLSFVLPAFFHSPEILNSLADLFNLFRIEIKYGVAKLNHPFLARIRLVYLDDVRIGYL